MIVITFLSVLFIYAIYNEIEKRKIKKDYSKILAEYKTLAIVLNNLDTLLKVIDNKTGGLAKILNQKETQQQKYKNTPLTIKRGIH